MIELPDGAVLDHIADEHGNLTALVRRRRADCVPFPPAPTPRGGSIAWYVPYTAVHPVTVDAAPKDAVWVDVSSSTEAYFSALHHIWAQGETFALLEHDVVCRPDVIAELEACPEPWCLYGYADICHPECQEAWRNQLGCTRFREELIAAVPDAISSIPPDERDWHNLCDRLGERLRAAGFTHHWHDPWVDHHRMMGKPPTKEEPCL